jgi:heat-inducible transcriptional repressor
MGDAPMLTARQESLLKLIVEEYVSTASPVASDALIRGHGIGVSPATVRKEMAELEEQGYLDRPHTSAGCVPLDVGYRFYVESLASAERTRVSERQRAAVAERLIEGEKDVETWTSRSSATLAELTGNLAVATYPKAADTRIRHVELVSVQSLLAMLIVVIGQATLRRHMVRLAEPIRENELESSARRVKSYVLGLTRDEIRSRPKGLTRFEEDLLDATLMILEEEERFSYVGHYVDGLRNLLSQPEFASNDILRPVVESIEDGSLIEAILRDAPRGGGVVRVVIGKENRADMLWLLSLVISQYGSPGQAMGAVGVVGPTRMEYPRTISGVELMSMVMSDMVDAGRVG